MKAVLRTLFRSTWLVSLCLMLAFVLAFPLPQTAAMQNMTLHVVSTGCPNQADCHPAPCTSADSRTLPCSQMPLMTDCCAHGLVALPVLWQTASPPPDSPPKPRYHEGTVSLILAVPQRPPTFTS
ncbi:hypothetical protein QCD60_18815 [Pokkaliibacter sp. MBI-7]|uniref:hypothetical protein n=1 Tax=Pokkaliibacter sp. MBI-7 TaxID=3040600 RepID=UPI00244AF435|nr:hypothetical protein [Pokkaliibacter sp. MBI-7]MDH2434599.1 hypothetical protein [Pokkaliibacter sp. MBI-7]